MAIATETPKDFGDLYTDLIQRVRADSSVTLTTNIAKRYINIGLQDMHIGSSERFPWAEREAILLTHPVYEFPGGAGSDITGGVFAFKSDTNLVFSKVVSSVTSQLGITDSNTNGQTNIRVGGKIRIDGATESFRIEWSRTVGSTDVANMVSAWKDDTTAFQAQFRYYEDEYDLAADFLRPVDISRFSSGPTGIKLIGRNKFRNRYPDTSTSGRPSVGTIIDRPVGTVTAETGATTDTVPRRRLRLYPYPDDAYRIRYTYITSNLATSSAGVPKTSLVEDTDEPIVPLRYRMLTVLHALSSWYRDRHDDPQRSQAAKADYEILMKRTRSDVEIGQSRPQLRPPAAAYKRRSQHPRRSGISSRFDMGNFDFGGR